MKTIHTIKHWWLGTLRKVLRVSDCNYHNDYYGDRLCRCEDSRRVQQRSR